MHELLIVHECILKDGIFLNSFAYWFFCYSGISAVICFCTISCVYCYDEEMVEIPVKLQLQCGIANNLGACFIQSMF